MNFINNPFEILEEIIREDYPQVDCDIIIGQQLTDGIESFGCTFFPEDKSERIVIEIHSSLSLKDATKILAHELAHVIAGEEADHGEEWEEAFADIHTRFQEKLDKRFGT